MRVTTLRINRLTIRLEPGDGHYYVPNPYSRSFYVEPAEVVAEYDSDQSLFDASIMRAEVTGQRYRHMASGEIRKVGPGRGPRTEEPTTLEFPSRNSMPEGLLKLLYDAWLRR
jgi:hypothetical protein